MQEENNLFLNKPVDVELNDGYHIYATLVKNELHGVWLKSKSETSFITFNNIRKIKLDRKYLEEDF